MSESQDNGPISPASVFDAGAVPFVHATSHLRSGVSVWVVVGQRQLSAYASTTSPMIFTNQI